MKLTKTFLLKFFLISLILIFPLILCVVRLKEKDFTVDELNYLNNSLNLIKELKWDTRHLRLHPPLTSYLHGLPLLLISTTNPWTQLFHARLSNLLLFVILGLSVFLITRKIYGFKAGLFALILCCFNPEILAHSRLITADLGLVLFTFLFLISFNLFLKSDKKNNKKEIIKTGIFLGLLLSTKYNAVVFIPLSCLLFVIHCLFFSQKRNSFKRLFQLLFIFFIAIFIVHLAYGFKESFQLPDQFQSSLFQKIKVSPILKTSLYFFPKPFLWGADYQISVSQDDWHWNFFLGERSSKGFKDFYFITFFLKTPIPLLIFLIWALFLLLKRKYSKNLFIDFSFFSVIAYFFIHFSFFNNINNGFRYVLPIYPLIFFFASRIIVYKFKQPKINFICRILVGVLLLWYFIGTLKIHPHYLAYFNEFIGGPKNAYKYFTDSTIDWGQDVLAVKKYIRDSKDNVLLSPEEPVVGKIAVRVTHMNQWKYKKYEWTRKLRELEKEPIDYIGYSWLIFDVTKEDLQKLDKVSIRNERKIYYPFFFFFGRKV